MSKLSFHFAVLPVSDINLAGWAVVFLLAPGLIVLVATVVAFLVRPRKQDGPGYYHILGFDQNTQSRREITVRADSRHSAEGRAVLDGIIVTEIRQVKDND